MLMRYWCLFCRHLRCSSWRFLLPKQRMWLRPMDKYCFFFIRVCPLAGHEYLLAIRKFLRDMNLLAMHNFQRGIKSSRNAQISTRHKSFSSCIIVDSQCMIFAMHDFSMLLDFQRGLDPSRDAQIPARHKFFSRCINFDEAWHLLVVSKFQRGIKSCRDI